ncbi:MAG: prepilin peptidase [Anaerovoracaceae bacterium]
MTYLAYGIIFLIVFLLGITIGSFLNVLIYRIPRKLDFVKGRSFCPRCENQLKALDLMPILSFLFLKGKCRYCNEKISIRYPLIEFLSGIGAIGSVAAFGLTIKALLIFLVIGLLIVITFIDIDFQEIPDGCNLAIFILGIILNFVDSDISIWSMIMGFFIISVPMLLLTMLIDGAFGGGDIKLVAACGVLLGARGVLLGSFVGIILGGIFGVYLLLSKRKELKEHFAFGPFLSVGMIVSIFFGTEIVSWYLGLFGI